LEQHTTIEKPVRQGFLGRYFSNLPIFFPLIGLFHIGLAVYEAWYWIGDDSVSRLYWLRPAVLLLYALFWCGACMLKKWAGIGYVVLSVINVSFHLFGPDIMLKRAIGDLLFVPIPANLLFAFLLLFYFKRMK